MKTAEKLTTIAENVSKVYDAGKKAEYDHFWDNFQQNGALMTYANAFTARTWNDTCYSPKYTIKSTAGLGMFYNSLITDTKVPIDLSTATNAQNLFGYASGMKYIRKLILSENITNFNNAFIGLSNLELLIVEGTIAANGIDLRWSTKLNKESIVSIINALSSTTSGLSITISKKAKEAVFTADEWATLEATKPNWTIALA